MKISRTKFVLRKKSFVKMLKVKNGVRVESAHREIVLSGSSSDVRIRRIMRESGLNQELPSFQTPSSINLLLTWSVVWLGEG